MNTTHSLDLFEPSEQASREEEGRAELARLGLIARGDFRPPARWEYFDRDARYAGRRDHDLAGAGDGWSPSKPVGQALRVAALIGAGMIASLAGLLG